MLIAVLWQKMMRCCSGLRRDTGLFWPGDKRYRRLFHEIPVGVYRSTPDGELVDVNPALVEMLGYESQKALLSANVFDLYLHPEDREYWQQQIHTRRGRFDFEVPMRKHNGTIIWVRDSSRVIYDKQGQVRFYEGTLEDMTEKKLTEEALRESEKKWRLLFENLPGGSFAVNRAYIIEDVNDVLCAITGYTKEELIGQRCGIICPKGPHKCPIFDLGKERISNDETSVKTKTGQLVPIIKSARKIPLEYHELIVENFQDITERKQAEEALLLLNEELELRVQQRTYEYQQANQDLQKSLEILQMAQEQLVQSEKMVALGKLVAGVAHEVNTPLGVGVTAASYFEQQTRDFERLYWQGELKRSDLEKYVTLATQSISMILGNLRRAAEQIQSFKQVAVDQTSSEKRLFNLKTYLDDVLLSLRPKLKKLPHTVTIECPPDLDLESYPGAFSQIITNLMINSFTHAFEGIESGEIRIGVTQREHELTLSYHDNGKGMTAEERTRIFEPFYTTKRSQGGSGLGLHIVYNLVTQRLNGHIECQSSPGAGATFLIQIPLNENSNSS